MDNVIEVILGRKGSGKTFLAKAEVRDKKRVLFFDPRRQFTGCGVTIETGSALKVFLDQFGDRNFRAVFQPRFPVIGSKNLVRKAFQHLCLLANQLRDFYLVVDEVDSCLSNSEEENAYFENIYQRGRHDAISLVVTTIRYTQVPRDITAQADIVISFNCHEPRDIEYLRERFGALADELTALPLYHYIRFDKEGVRRHEPVKF